MKTSQMMGTSASLRPKLVWRQVASELPRMLELHAHARDVVGLCRDLEDLLHKQLVAGFQDERNRLEGAPTLGLRGTG